MYGRKYFIWLVLILQTLLSLPTAALDVAITSELNSVEVMHDGKVVTIRRHQDPENMIYPIYARTSRPCPPFCIQPARLAEGVETIAELELLEYLGRLSAGDENILVIDSRTKDWLKHGTIPGSVNIPWTELQTSAGADPFSIADILEQKFGVQSVEGLWDFSRAKTLVLFCNGAWCGQSPTNIRSLLKLGYPPHRLKWYRGGMQSWHSLGLTVVR